MSLKKRRMTIGLDGADCEFLDSLNIFRSRADGIRFAVKAMRLYGIPAIRAIKSEIKSGA
jgi:hypothetical protein